MGANNRTEDTVGSGLSMQAGGSEICTLEKWSNDKTDTLNPTSRILSLLVSDEFLIAFIMYWLLYRSKKIQKL